ncbi:MAG: hypothetical protein Q4B12_05960, partial [Bowdeniella nasicola]|nr:hypothetical protein [Bowdeniella nasicola]
DAPEKPDAPEKTARALILTPLASPEALAGMCALADIAAIAVPSESGAIAVMDTEPADELEALTAEDGVVIPAEVTRAAEKLASLTPHGVVVLVIEMTASASEPTGQMAARHIVVGAPAQSLSPGLVLAGADSVVEDLALGLRALEDIEGTHDSTSEQVRRAAQAFIDRSRNPEDPA